MDIFGMDVHISPDIPRYQLPEEIIPGVPWDPKFRGEINSWAKEFLGTTNRIPDNTYYVCGTGYNKWVLMNPRSYFKFKHSVNNAADKLFAPLTQRLE